MREQQKDSVQSRFTTYLVVAVANRRKRYLEKKHRTMEREVVHEELLELGYVNFDMQYHTYVSDREALITENWTDLDTLTELLQTPQLIALVKGLKEKERKILYARVYGELSFQELGQMFHKTPYLMEMSYYYILRKMRKGLEERKDDF
ncbi:MAG: sigma-70 family RNA polymerase sigma factor [Lachnospiraceae bacterium]|nr:sigma-70 family RNA polymerase sigma factor [Lachnospiraceae bacterium]